MTNVGERGTQEGGFDDPAFLHAALTEPRLAWVWLVLRVGVGWFWLDTGWRGLHGSVAASNALAIGQTLAGIALVLGALTGIAAFSGGVLQLLVPAVSGPFAAALFAAVVLLVLAWKTAGWIGLDRWLLPLLGMPWRGGALLGDRRNENNGRKKWR